jgi:hypothetical protein
VSSGRGVVGQGDEVQRRPGGDVWRSRAFPISHHANDMGLRPSIALASRSLSLKPLAAPLFYKLQFPLRFHSLCSPLCVRGRYCCIASPLHPRPAEQGSLQRRQPHERAVLPHHPPCSTSPRSCAMNRTGRARCARVSITRPEETKIKGRKMHHLPTYKDTTRRSQTP